MAGLQLFRLVAVITVAAVAEVEEEYYFLVVGVGVLLYLVAGVA